MVCVEIYNNSFLIGRILEYLNKNDKLSGSTFIFYSSRDFGNVTDDGNSVDNPVFLPKEPVTIEYKDYSIQITYEKSRESLNNYGSEIRFDLVRLYSNDLKNIHDFIYDMENIIRLKEAEHTKYYWHTQDASWRVQQYFQTRSLDSIYLPESDKSMVVNTIDDFLNNTKLNDLMRNLGICSKKIFLFYGIPGTGKTSFIRSLASHFRYNICSVQNDTKLDDKMLENMFHKLPKNSFIVFEDMDSMFEQREQKTGVTFSGMLNVLDGMSKYKKMFVFITTNQLRSFNNALKRRIDTFLEFGYMKKEEIKKMYFSFFDQECSKEFLKTIKGMNITPNALEKMFIHCLQTDTKVQDNIEYLEKYLQYTEEKESNLYI